MKKNIFILIACLLSMHAQSQEAQINSSTTSLNAALACVQVYAITASKSNATAFEIAEASSWACKDEIDNLKQTHRSNILPLAKGKLPLDETEKIIEKHIETYKQIIRQSAIHSVIASRMPPTPTTKKSSL